MPGSDPMRPSASDVRLTYDDFVHFPDDGKRHELIDGAHVVTPSPNTKHQTVAGNLHGLIWTYLRQRPVGRVFAAPLDVVFSEFDVVEPDLLFVSKARQADIVTAAHVLGAPDLVVEIGSPSTRRRDETVKLRLYQRFGVSEYWVVDPELDVIKVYRSAEGRFDRVAELSLERDEVLESPLFPGLSVTTGGDLQRVDVVGAARPYLQGWLEEGIMPRATLAETDAAGADQALEVNYLDLFPFVTMYDSLFGDAWYGPPSRPFAAQLDTVHAQMTFGTDYYEQRRNAACLQNKTTAASQISSVSNINALYVTLFSLDRDPTYCARVDIAAVMMAVPSGATPGNVPTSIAVRFTDGVVAPDVSVVATVTATNGSASPAGGIVPTPITGPITVVLNPGQTSMQLTITAEAAELGLPLTTRVVQVAESSGGLVTFVAGSLNVTGHAVASNGLLTNGQSFTQRVETAVVGTQALSSGALSGQLNIFTMPSAVASGQASRAAVQTNPQAMQLHAAIRRVVHPLGDLRRALGAARRKSAVVVRPSW